MNRRDNRKRNRASIRFAATVTAVALLAAACGSSEGELSELQLVGVDFELNSMIIYNLSASEVRTEGLWAYRDGEVFEFDIFTIEPRATVLFSMRDLGEISVESGEVALADSSDLENPESLLEYVAWGDDGSAVSETATEAGLWPPEGTVATEADTIVLIRTDPAGNNPDSWEASSEIG
jgi:hypothetical protein